MNKKPPRLYVNKAGKTIFRTHKSASRDSAHQKHPFYKKKNLQIILMSGGLDSTYLLYKALQNPEELGLKLKNSAVLAHHVIFKNHEKRWPSEYSAIQRIYSILRKTMGYSFEDTTSTLAYSSRADYIPKDAHPLCFLSASIAATFAHRFNKIEVYVGWNSHDFKPETERGSTSRIPQHLESQRSKALKLFNMMNEHPKKISIHHPLIELNKKEMLAKLPISLQESLSFCRFPRLDFKLKTTEPCKKCKTCKQMGVLGFDVKNKIKLIPIIEDYNVQYFRDNHEEA